MEHQFSPDLRWGNFLLGSSWSIDKEAFISKISWIDNLKLRASELGNARLLTVMVIANIMDIKPFRFGIQQSRCSRVVLSSPDRQIYYENHFIQM
jgi:hypothetical protein